MKNYVLLYCREREMSILGVFSSLEEAQDAMRADFKKYHLEDLRMKWTDTRLHEDLLNSENPIDNHASEANT